tara:strand:+ start:2773 stop:2928 length:156 start_codon:yes stop_codon:yes gene_type:complete
VVTSARGEVLNTHMLGPQRCKQQERVINPHFIVRDQRDSYWKDTLNKVMAL